MNLLAVIPQIRLTVGLIWNQMIKDASQVHQGPGMRQDGVAIPKKILLLESNAITKDSLTDTFPLNNILILEITSDQMKDKPMTNSIG